MFTVLKLFIKEHGRSFNFFVSFSVFLQSLVKYTFQYCLFQPQYNLCYYVLKYVVSLICPSDSPSFVCGRGFHLFIYLIIFSYLILCPATTLIVFISCRSHFEDFLCSVVYAILPSANNNIFSFSLPIQISLTISFSYCYCFNFTHYV